MTAPSFTCGGHQIADPRVLHAQSPAQLLGRARAVVLRVELVLKG